MKLGYIILQFTESGRMVYPKMYATQKDAIASIKYQWMPFLEEMAYYNPEENPEEIWQYAVDNMTLYDDYVSIYLEKGNLIEIYEFELPS